MLSPSLPCAGGGFSLPQVDTLAPEVQSNASGEKISKLWIHNPGTFNSWQIMPKEHGRRGGSDSREEKREVCSGGWRRGGRSNRVTRVEFGV